MVKPHLTKLKLKFERARRGFFDAQTKKNDAWLEYLTACRAEGLCANCERSLTECRCVFLAAGDDGSLTVTPVKS